jgi:hypothetical protein
LRQANGRARGERGCAFQKFSSFHDFLDLR